jgi:nucleotide-binding universal stress UspA family protein
MNSIVALTDFTPAADNAALYAARLAGRLGAGLTLLHIYQLPVSMNDMPVLVVSADELKNNSEAGLQNIREQLLREVPSLSIHTHSRLGDLNDEINAFCKEVPVRALVMGTHHYTGLEKALFGRTPLSVIRHCRYPVITVPETFARTAVRKIVFATDLEPIEAAVAEQVTGIVRQLGAELDIVHVGVDEEEMAAEAFLQAFQSLRPAYHSVRHDHVTEGLQNYIQTSGADLVVSLPHQHSLLEAFLFKVHTKDFVDKLDVPLLFIHTP